MEKQRFNDSCVWFPLNPQCKYLSDGKTSGKKLVETRSNLRWRWEEVEIGIRFCRLSIRQSWNGTTTATRPAMGFRCGCAISPRNDNRYHSTTSKINFTNAETCKNINLRFRTFLRSFGDLSFNLFHLILLWGCERKKFNHVGGSLKIISVFSIYFGVPRWLTFVLKCLTKYCAAGDSQSMMELVT